VTATPDQFYARVRAAADDEGRLPLSRMTAWEVFPFEPDGLRVVPLRPPVLPEPARRGEGGNECDVCSRADARNSDDAEIWRNERWRLLVWPESGAPLVLMLQPLAHHDLADLPDDLAAELGQLTVSVARAVEALPHVSRCHVSRWGDGGAHLHVFFFARPEGFPQLRGTCLAIWDDLLPATASEVLSANAGAVARALAGWHGGSPR